ncbi:MAG: TIR domain-containing protein [Lewinellaceae bacterium]|nr:TIR domain-containing protein [Lewinellaceae bacterium]
MSELALKLIRENIEKHRRGEDARFLDLGNCGLSHLPPDMGACEWLETLILSNAWWEYDIEQNKKREWKESQNGGEPNRIASIKGVERLGLLKKLVVAGAYGEFWRFSDLAPLADLLYLQILFCRNTQVSDLAPLAGLLNLQQLDCRNTQIEYLAPLSRLRNLQLLYGYNTQITDLSPLSGLLNLKRLDLSLTQISKLSPLADLPGLQRLYCTRTQVRDISPLNGLVNLQRLYCSRTQVSNLSPLSDLVNLQRLDCARTQVNDLSPLSDLINLQRLDCARTQVSDLSPLSNLPNLQRLDCAGTQVSDLSPLSGLVNIKRLDCARTQVNDLSPVLTLIQHRDILVKWKDVNEHDQEENVNWRDRPAILAKNCPLIIPPVEVAQESPQAVRDYFEELGDDGRKLNEVKVIFLGEASAGKTSLVKRLLGEDFDSKESQTHGIRIRKAPFAMDDGDSVTAHLWDFGGQEVMHATHQFFLSQRSVYVLLLNSRNDDQAEKWLKHAASFGGRSPVLVVLNKIDENPSFEVNRKTLQEKYPQIRDFFRLSAKTDKGLDEFREALRREIDRADTRRTPFPKHWLAVKEHFSNMEADYIESMEYRRVCGANGVTRQFSQDVLLQFLHDLGVVINFRNLKNFDTQILNPLWLTNGVYRIINSEIVANAGGLLQEDDFDAVINDPRYKKDNTIVSETLTTSQRLTMAYPKNKLQYIVRVMQEFELCFQLDPCIYVVPQLLPVQEPVVTLEGSVLRFVIHFPDFLPDSVFPRLMVKLHTFIAASDGLTLSQPITKHAWRTGMVLHKPNIFNALARVRWDKEDQKILMDVCGEERRRFLSFIRETVKEIVADFTNLNFSELVPIPESKDTEEYEYLVEAEKAGEKEVFVKSLKKRVYIADLLDGVEEPAMRDEVEQLPVKAFVSYSHADLEHLKTLKNALSPLIRLNKLQVWDDKNIEAGDEWEKVIFQQLEEADIVLCLVSADFVASDFCYKKEFGAALEAHRKGDKTIVPVMLRSTDWKDLPLSEIQGVPGEWITSAANKDEAWTKVSESLRPALDKAKQRKKIRLEKRPV